MRLTFRLKTDPVADLPFLLGIKLLMCIH